MKIGIVAFPSKKLQDLANNYRKRYDPHYAQITPHITLKDTFEIDENRINEVTDTLEKVASKYGPIKLLPLVLARFFQRQIQFFSALNLRNN